uniref:TPT domain-containing protein n=1 Tax=Ascaris lumbricoides TaxID=6252 RepID=A0A0M3IUR4_ASCLU
MLAKPVEEHNEDNPEVVRGASFSVYIRSSLLLLLLTACYLLARFMGISTTNCKASKIDVIQIITALTVLLHG